MTEYIDLNCARCSRTLRVRLEYVGHEVACNHCDQTFLATSRDPRVLQFLLHAGRPATPEVTAPGAPDTIETGEPPALESNAVSPTDADRDQPPLLPDGQQARDPFEPERIALKAELDQCRLQIATLHSELEAARHAVETLEHERDRLTTVHMELKQWRSDAEIREERQRTELTAAQNQSASERQQHRAEMHTLEEQFAQQQRQLQDQIDRLTEQATRLEQDREILAGQLGQFRDQVASLEDENATHRSQLELVVHERERAFTERDLSDRARQEFEAKWQATLTQLNQAVTEAQRQDERNEQRERATTEEICRLSEQIDERRTRATELEKSLAVATQELDAARGRFESEGQEAFNKLSQEQARHDDERRQWQEQLNSLERQLLQERQSLQLELDRARNEAAELRAEHDSVLGQIAGMQQDYQRLLSDADEVALARRTQRRSVVKIARLTRSLQRAWNFIEQLRLRNHELAKRVDEKTEEARTIAGADRVPLDAT